MKQERCILVIDDKDQEDVIGNIKLKLQKEFDLDFITIQTAAADLKENNSEELDVKKLKDEIIYKIKGKHIDIALTDFDLGCSLTGLDVVHMVHDIRPKVKFFVYSGNWNKVIKSVVGQEHSKATVEELVEGINKLIKAKIIDCVDRTDYQGTLIDYIEKNKGDSIEHRLSSLLRANGDMVFESCFPEFKGMTFSEIADKIDSHSDARSDEWIEAILAQTIAYLVKINQ